MTNERAMDTLLWPYATRLAALGEARGTAVLDLVEAAAPERRFAVLVELLESTEITTEA